MKLLLTITAYPPSIGGAQIHTHELLKSLLPSHDVNVISLWNSNRTDWLLGTTLKAPSYVNEYLINGVNVHQLGFSKNEKKRMVIPTVLYYLMMGWSIGELSGIINSYLSNEGNIDLVHNVRIGREPISFASLKYARQRNVPFIFTPLHHPRWSGWLHRYYHQLYRESDALIALTDSEKKKLVELGVNEKAVFVTGIGPILAETYDEARFRSSYRLGDGPIMLFLGQKYFYKGVSSLLDAASIVWKKFPEAMFVFIGPRTKYSTKLFKKVK